MEVGPCTMKNSILFILLSLEEAMDCKKIFYMNKYTNKRNSKKIVCGLIIQLL